jgi:hypothetical protein
MEAIVDDKKTVTVQEYKKVYITGSWADVEDSDPF